MYKHDVYYDCIVRESNLDSVLYKRASDMNEEQEKKNKTLKGYIYFKCDEENKCVELKNGTPYKNNPSYKNDLFLIHNSRANLLRMKKLIEKYKLTDDVYTFTDNTMTMIIKAHINAKRYGGVDNNTYDYTQSDEELSDIEFDFKYWAKKN